MHVRIGQEFLNMCRGALPKSYVFRHWMPPRNFVTDKEYNGMNSVILQATEGWDGIGSYPAFATFKQVKALGGHIKSGSKAVAYISHYKSSFSNQRLNQMRQQGDPISYWMEHGTWTWTPVFHFSQCEQLPQDIVAKVEQWINDHILSFFDPKLLGPPKIAPPIPSLSSLCLKTLVRQKEQHGVDSALIAERITSRPCAWWPAFGMAEPEHLLEQFVDHWKENPDQKIKKGHEQAAWSYDTETKTLVSLPKAIYIQQPHQYYSHAFRAIATALADQKTLEGEVLTWQLLKQVHLPYVAPQVLTKQHRKLEKTLKKYEKHVEKLGKLIIKYSKRVQISE
jgi:hypothetical protein